MYRKWPPLIFLGGGMLQDPLTSCILTHAVEWPHHFRNANYVLICVCLINCSNCSLNMACVHSVVFGSMWSEQHTCTHPLTHTHTAWRQTARLRWDEREATYTGWNQASWRLGMEDWLDSWQQQSCWWRRCVRVYVLWKELKPIRYLVNINTIVLLHCFSQVGSMPLRIVWGNGCHTRRICTCVVAGVGCVFASLLRTAWLLRRKRLGSILALSLVCFWISFLLVEITFPSPRASANRH